MTLWLGMTSNDVLSRGQAGISQIPYCVTLLSAAAGAHMSALETSHHAANLGNGWMAERKDGRADEALEGYSMSNHTQCPLGG